MTYHNKNKGQKKRSTISAISWHCIKKSFFFFSFSLLLALLDGDLVIFRTFFRETKF